MTYKLHTFQKGLIGLNGEICNIYLDNPIGMSDKAYDLICYIFYFTYGIILYGSLLQIIALWLNRYPSYWDDVSRNSRIILWWNTQLAKDIKQKSWDIKESKSSRCAQSTPYRIKAWY